MRPAAAGVALGLALAVGAPATWVLTRPAAAAGAPVAEVLSAPASTSAAPRLPDRSVDRDPDRFPELTARPAAPERAAKAPAPERIRSEDLGIDAPVDVVGLADDGSMELPADVDRAGWYRFGPAPGEKGSAVIAGHVDDVQQGLGALAPLRTADVGDAIAVVDAEGGTTRWQVVARETISKRKLPLDELFRRDGPPRLTLITCGGPFLPEYGGYADNVVVVAEPLS